MKSVLHIIARLVLLLSLAVAPLYGVTAPLVMHDMDAAQSQDRSKPPGMRCKKTIMAVVTWRVAVMMQQTARLVAAAVVIAMWLAALSAYRMKIH